MDIKDNFGRLIGRSIKTGNGEIIYDSAGRAAGCVTGGGAFDANMRLLSAQQAPGFLYSRLDRSRT